MPRLEKTYEFVNCNVDSARWQLPNRRLFFISYNIEIAVRRGLREKRRRAKRGGSIVVPQVKVVAILMIVNGAIVSLMGLYLVIIGPAMFTMMKVAPPPQGPNAGGPEAMILGIMSAVYFVLGLLVLVASVLNIVAGIRSLKYRGRTFAIVALFSNIAALFTCYCFPLALGVMIYGLIVFFQSDVADAFARVAEGLPPERVKYGWRPADEPDDEWDEELPLPPLDRPRRGDNVQRGPDDTYT